MKNIKSKKEIAFKSMQKNKNKLIKKNWFFSSSFRILLMKIWEGKKIKSLCGVES